MKSRALGMTLIEVVLFIVIVGVGLAGVLAVFNTTVRGSADPMVRKQALAAAESLLEEITAKYYSNPTGACPGTCDRTQFDDVSDYNGYSLTGIVAIDGVTPVAGLASYTLAVAVDEATATLGALGSPNVKKITVTVSGGGESITLVGYRTNYETVP